MQVQKWIDIMNITEVENKMKSAIESLEKRYLNIRAGRANPSMLN